MTQETKQRKQTLFYHAFSFIVAVFFFDNSLILLILVVITQIFIPTTELVIPTGTPANEVNV